MPKSRTERPRKTKIGIEVAYVKCDSGTTLRSKGQRSRSPGRFAHRRVGASGGCNGGHGNMLAVGNCCYVAVCSAAQGASAPTGRRGGAYRGGRPPTACYIKTGVRPRASFKETAGYRRQRRRCRQPETGFLIPVTCPLVDHTVTGKKSLME